MDDLAEETLDPQQIAEETPTDNVFIPPSITHSRVVSGESYTYHSPVPKTLLDDMTTECVLGVDEAGRGPVLGT